MLGDPGVEIVEIVVDEIAAFEQGRASPIEDDVLVHPALFDLAGAIAPDAQQLGWIIAAVAYPASAKYEFALDDHSGHIVGKRRQHVSQEVGNRGLEIFVASMRITQGVVGAAACSPQRN